MTASKTRTQSYYKREKHNDNNNNKWQIVMALFNCDFQNKMKCNVCFHEVKWEGFLFLS